MGFFPQYLNQGAQAVVTGYTLKFPESRLACLQQGCLAPRAMAHHSVPRRTHALDLYLGNRKSHFS